MGPILSDDERGHRDWLLSFLPGDEPSVIVDLGCGQGADLLALAQRSTHPETRLIGVDASVEAVRKAGDDARGDPRIEVRHHHLNARLPFDDRSCDVVYSSNLLECLTDRAAFVREVARVLRPGKTVVTAHWDWDSQVFDGTDKALIRKLVHAFADWQQDWMDSADGWTGRRLWGFFNASGLFSGEVHARVLTSTAWAPSSYGHARARDLDGLVRRGMVDPGDYRQFIADQEALSARGAYFYSITGYVYVGRLA
ncbi:MAG: methyltransferase domain-containing protein [bacterium]|nr:methyltransferase domain-containing protein [bacterium]